MRNTRTGGLVSLLCTIALAATAEAGPVEEALGRLADATRLERPLRAEGTIRLGATGATRRIVLLLRPEERSASVMLALPDDETRVLVDARGEARLATEGEVSPAKLDTPIGETRLFVEDLLPLDPARCMGVHVVDAGRLAVTLRCDPAKEAGSPYALTVWRLGRESGAVENVLYYRGTTNNLAKRLEIRESVSVAGKPRPSLVSVDDYAIGAEDRIELTWSEPDAIDARAFDPAAFATVPLGDR